MAGIYIHIPFCHQACVYCNFHFSTSVTKKDRMVEAIIREVSLNDFIRQPGLKIETIYVGGGTPSILSATELHSILQAVRQAYTVDPAAEITLEANPEDIGPASLEAWLGIGVNRLSVGIQSFDDL